MTIFCPKCQSENLRKAKGKEEKKQQFQCKDCKKYFSVFDEEEQDLSTKEVEISDNNMHIISASKRIKTEEDLLKEFNVDLNKWKLDKIKIHTSEGYRKDKKVQWKVKDGKVLDGCVSDSGKLLIAPMYHIKASFIRKTEEIRYNLIKDDIINEIKNHKPKFPTINYSKKLKNFLFEPDMPDIHFGKLTWGEESGDNYDTKIAREMCLDHLNSLCNHAKHYDVEKILFPIGNDFFNVDNPEGETTRGTPQQQDTRFKKMFRKGHELVREMINMVSAIAPVDVKIIVGNHDTNTAFFLGEVLEGYYYHCKFVNIDNEVKKRKYYQYGKNLIGLTHGYYEKLNELPLIMATEQPKLWANTRFHEWQTGDKHHKKEIRTSMLQHEQMGVMVRILRSISGNDTWHFDKGYIGQNRLAEGFIRHKEKGLVCQFNSSI